MNSEVSRMVQWTKHMEQQICEFAIASLAELTMYIVQLGCMAGTKADNMILNYCIAGFICEVLNCANHARGCELA